MSSASADGACDAASLSSTTESGADAVKGVPVEFEPVAGGAGVDGWAAAMVAFAVAVAVAATVRRRDEAVMAVRRGGAG